MSSPGGQSEQVVHGVRVVPQAVGLLQQLEGGHTQRLRDTQRLLVIGLAGGVA